MPEQTIPQLFEDSVKKFGKNTMMWEKRGRTYEGTTYADIKARVEKFSAGLVRLGLKPGDRVALISEGRNDWVVSELGILYARSVNVPISVKINEKTDLKFRLAHSGCRMVVVSGSQAEKVRKIKNDLPDLEKTILLDEDAVKEDDEISIEEVIKEGIDYLSVNRASFESLFKSIKEDDEANICYTSGTTADPKGIVLTHRNYTANVEQSASLINIPEWYVTLLILPWDHAFAHTCGIYTVIKSGAAMAAVEPGKTAMETIRNIPKNIKEIRPTVLLSVPALAKNFRLNIEKAIQEKGAKIERLYRKALSTAYAYNREGWNKGQGLDKLKKPLLALYDKLIFKKIRTNFGGRLDFFVGGGALLDIELQRFFYAIGMPMFQGYGLTEAAPVISANSPAEHKLGSSGTIAENMDVMICDNEGKALYPGETGEIVVKGENVMKGYWKNPKATEEALRGGWLYTGDIGYFDEDGFLYVLGRVKSLLIGSDGEKYSPEGIEEAIADNSVFIDQMMLYNNQSPYSVALVVPNKGRILHQLKEKGLSNKTAEGQKAALQMIEGEISPFRTGGMHENQFPQRWLPSAIAVLGQDFTEENGFLNSTLKMVRNKIAEFYKNRIDFMFTSEGKDLFNHQNMTIIARMGQEDAE